ncbi:MULTISPECIES: GNAT family N-acetyltransferase [Oleiagrimonas]|jgi:putative acetyltransferase|uniref:GNAT family N-acetyltransferase n=1 Tax=Oleiagrimonas citrea TaxID=1665687 RepID=A0A846ZQF7_9GAMM|nr:MULTISPECIES: GNAT family N-acetyltransferase [Oleiagrimonas]NKZ39887.1 GNAT family N-acetyltransferase [Oleiagrimonas citrea]RAP56929.1 GNAT family N-acetyltransferase [Oleiagrimonas sp. MCCC 1A03011]
MLPDIRIDTRLGPDVACLLDEHLRDMRAVSPPESKHALDLDSLRAPDITFWTAHRNGRLIGCGALKALDAEHGEIKSMRIDAACRGQGVGSMLLQHIEQEARRRGYTRLSLETGSMDFFLPARALYARHGFTPCPPFAAYRPDPNSVFMTKRLSDSR